MFLRRDWWKLLESSLPVLTQPNQRKPLKSWITLSVRRRPSWSLRDTEPTHPPPSWYVQICKQGRYIFLLLITSTSLLPPSFPLKSSKTGSYQAQKQLWSCLNDKTQFKPPTPFKWIQIPSLLKVWYGIILRGTMFMETFHGLFSQ